jgi:hypothetical protein
VLSKLWICWAVGGPPKKPFNWLLLYQGWAPPVVIAEARGNGPLPTLMNACAGAAAAVGPGETTEGLGAVSASWLLLIGVLIGVLIWLVIGVLATTAGGVYVIGTTLDA